ncbi:hypothetical protein F4677DRAFT_451002 [Hypoxylon crocopeplum]|nr:hypothetical protein F4677DRAFT_451002 [Hypoxylon crocopeplum]
MAGASNETAYNGVTLPKPDHHFSGNPPTAHPVDKQSLGTYRLELYRNGPDSVPLAQAQALGAGAGQASDPTRIVTEMNDILSRLSH